MDQGFKDAFLEGGSVTLRPLRPEDINERYVSWLNDPEVTRYLEVGRFPSTIRDLERFHEACSASRNAVMLAVCLRDGGRHVGNIELGRIDWVHRHADIGILIGEKDQWGQGVGSEALVLMLAYAFDRLDLKKIIMGAYSSHAAAIRMYERAGFRVEGQLTSMLNDNGIWVDKVILGMTQAEYHARRT